MQTIVILRLPHQFTVLTISANLQIDAAGYLCKMCASQREPMFAFASQQRDETLLYFSAMSSE